MRYVYRSLRTNAAMPSRYRRSHRRLRALRLRDTWSREFWVVVIWAIIAWILMATGVIEHPPHVAH
jgi:hypothetical protein